MRNLRKKDSPQGRKDALISPIKNSNLQDGDQLNEMEGQGALAPF